MILLAIALMIQEAKPTDGTAPDYVVEPVTRKIPHCGPRETLKIFSPAFHPEWLGTMEDRPFPASHDAAWVNPTEFGPDSVEGVYRCFPAQVAEEPVVGEHYDRMGYEFPSNPAEGSFWRDPQGYIFVFGNLHWFPYKRSECPDGLHLHPRDMVTKSADVVGGPLPKADGKCHKNDVTDKEVKP